jgi:hypothetical protein
LRHDRRKASYRFGKRLELVAREVERDETQRHMKLAASAKHQLHLPVC